MATCFVNIARRTPMLLPPDLKEWVGDNDRAKFFVEADHIHVAKSHIVQSLRSDKN